MVAIVVRVMQWRAAKTTRANVKSKKVAEDRHDGGMVFDPEHLDSLLHQLARNQVQYTIEIAFTAAGVAFAPGEHRQVPRRPGMAKLKLGRIGSAHKTRRRG
jgi:hypothetical protein